MRIARDEKSYILSTTDAEFKEFGDAIRAQDKGVDEDVAKLRELSSDEGKVRVDAFGKAWDAFMVTNEKVRQFADMNSGVAARLKLIEARKTYDTAAEILCPCSAG